MRESINPGERKVSLSKDWCRGIDKILSLGHDPKRKAEFIVEFANEMKSKHNLEPVSLEILRDMYRDAKKLLEVTKETKEVEYDAITKVALEVFPGSRVVNA